MDVVGATMNEKENASGCSVSDWQAVCEFIEPYYNG